MKSIICKHCEKTIYAAGDQKEKNTILIGTCERCKGFLEDPPEDLKKFLGGECDDPPDWDEVEW